MGRKDYLYGVRMLIPKYEFNPVKVGFTTNGQLRALSYLSGPFPVEWLGEWPAKNGKMDEAVIHERFSEDRLTGEWFLPNPDLLELIDRNVKAYLEAIEKAKEGHNGEMAKRARKEHMKAWWLSQVRTDAYENFDAKLALADIRHIPCDSCREKLLLESSAIPRSCVDDLQERLEKYQKNRVAIVIFEDELASALDLPVEKIKAWYFAGLLPRFKLHRKPSYPVKKVFECFETLRTNPEFGS